LNSLFIQGGEKEKIKVENGLQAQFAREPNTPIVSVYEVYVFNVYKDCCGMSPTTQRGPIAQRSIANGKPKPNQGKINDSSDRHGPINMCGIQLG